MKYYKFTLLKDLPNIPAGFSFTLGENDMERGPYGIYRHNDDGPDYEYTEKIRAVWRYKDNHDWVKVEYDLSKAIQIKCPKCDSVGMFNFYDKEDEEYDDGVSAYYKSVGLQCPSCEYRLYTHRVHTHTEVKF